MYTAEAVHMQTQSWVHEAVQRRRTFGVKRAVSEVARLYGIGERRVISYLRGQVRHPPAHEFLNIQAKARADLEAWIRRSDAEAEAARTRLAEWKS